MYFFKRFFYSRLRIEDGVVITKRTGKICKCNMDKLHFSCNVMLSHVMLCETNHQEKPELKKKVSWLKLISELNNRELEKQQSV